MTRIPALGPRGEGWLAGQIVLFGLAFGAGVVGSGAWRHELRSVTTVAAGVLILAGGLLAIRGILDLRENLTPLPAPVREGHLVEGGVYSIVRHPIYTGVILAAFGWGLFTASPAALGVAAIIALFFDLKSRREESWLAEKYPGYSAYRARTRKLIPWIY